MGFNKNNNQLFNIIITFIDLLTANICQLNQNLLLTVFLNTNSKKSFHLFLNDFVFYSLLPIPSYKMLLKNIQTN